MDVDIDFQTTFKTEELFPWARASLVKNDELQPHPCGYYPQEIPIDVLTGLAAIPYKEAEDLGYYKIDTLHLHIYDNFQTRSELERLIHVEPDWGLLTVPSVQAELFQLSKHGDVLNLIKPRSVEELADVLALIRPGKRKFVKLYRSQKDKVRQLLYQPDENGYSFKRSHAIAYSYVIILQLHLLSRKTNKKDQVLTPSINNLVAF